MKLGLPIGNEDFASLTNKYYVDKTLIIKDIVETGIGSTILITRPRRFGKTLTMSTIETFFDINSQSSNLFSHLLVSKEKDIVTKYMNNYPVVRINMKDVFGSNKQEIIDSIIDKISLLYRNYIFLKDSDKLIDIEKEEFMQILEKRASNTLLSFSLSRLIIFLSKHYERKAILLIDEYDNPIEKAYENGCYDEIMNFIKPFYSSVLKGSDHLLFGVVTGVLQIAKESLFSGLNNLMISSVCDTFLNKYFGFNEKEVNDILNYFEIKESVETLRKWYGGYNLIGDEEMFNPWSILNYVFNKQLDRYWVNTGSNEILRHVFQKKELEFSTLELIGTRLTSIQSIKEINYKIFNQDGISLMSFLIQTGYITLAKVEREYEILIPNQEVRDLFVNEIINRGRDDSIRKSGDKLREAILSADTDFISKAMRDYVLRSFTYYDLRDEKDYQNIISEFLNVFFEDYYVKNEVIAGDGRCDIILIPKNGNKLGMVLEIKMSYSKKEPSKANLEKIACNALKQIHDKKYVKILKEVGIKKALLYGFAFYKKVVAIKQEIVEL